MIQWCVWKIDWRYMRRTIFIMWEIYKFNLLSPFISYENIEWPDNKIFGMLFDQLLEAFPSNIQLPKILYEAKKIIEELGFHCEKIVMCLNNCMLYIWEHFMKDKYDKCIIMRWKVHNYFIREKNVPRKDIMTISNCSIAKVAVHYDKCCMIYVLAWSHSYEKWSVETCNIWWSKKELW